MENSITTQILNPYCSEVFNFLLENYGPGPSSKLLFVNLCHAKGEMLSTRHLDPGDQMFYMLRPVAFLWNSRVFLCGHVHLLYNPERTNTLHLPKVSTVTNLLQNFIRFSWFYFLDFPVTTMGSCLCVPRPEDEDLEELRKAVLEAPTLLEREDLILQHLKRFSDCEEKKDQEILLATLANIICIIDTN